MRGTPEDAARRAAATSNVRILIHDGSFAARRQHAEEMENVLGNFSEVFHGRDSRGESVRLQTSKFEEVQSDLCLAFKGSL
jgi:hypothetical protein